MATTERTYLAGDKNKSDTFTLNHTSRTDPLNYGIHLTQHKNLPNTTAPNLSKLHGKIIYTIPVLGNFHKKKQGIYTKLFRPN